jgi:hypothetical protein
MGFCRHFAAVAEHTGKEVAKIDDLVTLSIK